MNARETATPPDRDPVPLDSGSGGPAETAPGVPNEPLSITAEDPDVGLSQKGSGEDAIVRRETEI
ncbi:hypothetical protein ACRAWG_23280 [Methylobacterium sp. P31]